MCTGRGEQIVVQFTDYRDCSKIKLFYCTFMYVMYVCHLYNVYAYVCTHTHTCTTYKCMDMETMDQWTQLFLKLYAVHTFYV